MLCKMGLKYNKNFQLGLIVLGVITLALGLTVIYFSDDNSSYALGLFSGMLSGIGSAALVIGFTRYMRIKKLSQEQLDKLMHQYNDERNQSIVNNAARVTIIIVGVGALVVSLLAAFMNHVEVTFALIGMIYAILIVFVLSTKHFENTL